MSQWDETTDFLVIGSGAGGLAAALKAHDLGAKSLILEKSDRYGGSSAMSGGTIWVPANQHMLEAGFKDSAEDGLKYLEAVVKGVESDRLKAYVEQIPKMVSYLHQQSDVQFTSMLKYPDYYLDQPGSKEGGRTIEPVPFNGLLLGEEFDNMRLPHPQILIMDRLLLTAVEAHKVSSGSPAGILLLLWIMLRYFLNIPARLKHKRSTRLALGNGLIGRLRYSLLKRKVPIWYNINVEELLMAEGRVVGALVEKAGRKIRIHATKGVLMSTGGFERNKEMREQYQRQPITTNWTAAHAYNTGDGILLGQQVGAAVDQMNDAWWNNTTIVPGQEMAWLLVLEKNKPGSILINKQGQRFTNEAAPYVDVVNAMYATHDSGTPCIPAYLVFDARYRHNYPCGPVMPGKVQPDKRLPDALKKQFLKRADTLDELAQQLDVPADNLKATIERFNQFARSGKDEDFSRGESLFDLYYGDNTIKPNATLAEVKRAPFYAIEVWPGDVGTKGGLQTDQYARVIDTEGNPIPGLFATGNCTASVMGNVCPGAGATIGPAMVFGYIAAQQSMKVINEGHTSRKITSNN